MFLPEGQIRVHLYGYPCDMRKSFQGLYALTRQGLQADPLSGDLSVFISRRATMMKVLYFDRSGCFVSDWSQVRTHEMEWTGLKLMLDGNEPGRLRKRYRLPRSLQKTTSNTSSSSLTPLQCLDGTETPGWRPRGLLLRLRYLSRTGNG